MHACNAPVWKTHSPATLFPSAPKLHPSKDEPSLSSSTDKGASREPSSEMLVPLAGLAGRELDAVIVLLSGGRAGEGTVMEGAGRAIYCRLGASAVFVFLSTRTRPRGKFSGGEEEKRNTRANAGTIGRQCCQLFSIDQIRLRRADFRSESCKVRPGAWQLEPLGATVRGRCESGGHRSTMGRRTYTAEGAMWQV